MTKAKKKKIESLLYAGFGAFGMVINMSDGKITDGAIKIRDKVITDILKLLPSNPKEQ